MPKNRYTRRIDRLPPFVAGAVVSAPSSSADDPAPPPAPFIQIPVVTNLSLSTAVYHSAVTPSSLIAVTWTGLALYPQAQYAVQWSTDSGFADALTMGAVTGQQAYTILGLRANVLYYVRVAAVVSGQYSDWASSSITTANDTAPPSPVTAQAAAFINAGDLVITWTNPTSLNFKDTEIGIYSDAAKTTQYALIHDATGRYVWTAAQNLAATSNAGDPTLWVELRAMSWNNIFSTAVNTGTITKARPATVTGLTNTWAGDTGTAGPDCLITWTAAADASSWQLTIDGTVYSVVVPYLNYALDRNRAAHAGTPDPVLSLSIVGVDGLKQTSAAAATQTATNAAPAAPTVVLKDGFSLIVAQVTTASAADFLTYEYVWKRDTVTQRTLESRGSEQQYETTNAGDEGTHNWTVTVRQKDVFNQFSTATVSSTVVHDALTISYLRGGAFYSDDIGSTFVPPSGGALAAMKDTITLTGGIAYSA